MRRLSDIERKIARNLEPAMALFEKVRSCFHENNQCQCAGDVKIGIENKWSCWKGVTGSFPCTTKVLGGDPAPGANK